MWVKALVVRGARAFGRDDGMDGRRRKHRRRADHRRQAGLVAQRPADRVRRHRRLDHRRLVGDLRRQRRRNRPPAGHPRQPLPAARHRLVAGRQHPRVRRLHERRPDVGLHGPRLRRQRVEGDERLVSRVGIRQQARRRPTSRRARSAVTSSSTWSIRTATAGKCSSSAPRTTSTSPAATGTPCSHPTPRNSPSTTTSPEPRRRSTP